MPMMAGYQAEEGRAGAEEKCSVSRNRSWKSGVFGCPFFLWVKEGTRSSRCSGGELDV